MCFNSFLLVYLYLTKNKGTRLEQYPVLHKNKIPADKTQNYYFYEIYKDHKA